MNMKLTKRSKTNPRVLIKPSLVRLFPFGVNMVNEGSKPLLLLKDDNSKYHLSVPVNPIEAGVTLAQSNKLAKPATPHAGTRAILESLGLEIKKAIFEEVKNSRQMIRVYFRNHPFENSLLLPAEDVISLCLFLEVPVFASVDFMNSNLRHLSDLEGMMEGLRADPMLAKRNHAYIQ